MSRLTQRSELLKAIRYYFESESVIEVTTPLLRDTGANEPHLDSVTIDDPGGRRYLQTSPEYAMKLLLASYKESIFQICPAFRRGEEGSRHKTEFQMLEWYRCDFTLNSLMDDLDRLLATIAQRVSITRPLARAARVSYRELFESQFGVNPHQLEMDELVALAAAAGVTHLNQDDTPADFLDGLFAAGIEPKLQMPTIVFDYPANQAALAEIKTTKAGDQVSDRFELFMAGLEIANAYQELGDGVELAARFAQNNIRRKQMGKAEMPIDQALIAAVNQLGRCAGIALGIDRLAMVLTDARTIDEVNP